MAAVDASVYDVVGGFRSSAAELDLRVTAAVRSLSAPDDTTAPTVDSFSPSSGASIERVDPLTFHVTDASSLVSVVVTATQGGLPVEVVHSSVAFLSPYDDDSARSTIASGYSYTVERTGGWQDAALTLTVVATDARGNTTTQTATFTVTDPPGPPAVDTFSPADGSSISKTTGIGFEVHTVATLLEVVIYATYGSGAVDLIYDGTGFHGDYATTSARTAIADGYAFDIGPAPQWEEEDLVVTIVATDVLGRQSTTDYALTITDPPAVDTSAPVVANPYPSPGSKVASDQEIGADVTDDGAFRRIVVVAKFTGYPNEEVYDGQDFAPWYASSSTATPITGGFRFRVKRHGGWPSAPSLKFIPIDQSGKEGA